MGITGIETSLKMFEKFLSSEGGVKIANKYSDDIIFGLDESQTIPLTQKLYPSGIYKVMINWKNQPSTISIELDLDSWLPVFGFPSNVVTKIIGYRKVN